jgi:hypothetical protein
MPLDRSQLWSGPYLLVGYISQLQMKLQFVSSGVLQIEALQATRKSPARHEHTESRFTVTAYRDVRTDRNNTAEHTAEIVVASHRAAEIE